MIGPFAMAAVKAAFRLWDKCKSPSRAEIKRRDLAWAQSLEKMARERDLARASAEAIENARRYCDDCKTEISNPDASYCPNCGSSQISSNKEIRERELAEAQAKRRQQQEKEARIQAEGARKQAAKLRKEQERQEQEQAKLREDAAKKKCREIAAWQFCSRCRCERETTDQFCIKCGGVLELIPPNVAFEWAKKELPGLVHTKEDFNRFVKWSQRLRQ